jgi:hypothetical protein
MTVLHFFPQKFPAWAWPTIADVPDGGETHKVELIHLHDSLQTPDDQVMHFGKAKDDAGAA